MERRNESVDLESLKNRFANLENELDMAYRRIKALLSVVEELQEDNQKLFSLWVRERSKNTSPKQVAKWRNINPEGLKTLQNPKELPLLAQNKRKMETWTPERLRKFADILEKSPAQHRRERVSEN